MTNCQPWLFDPVGACSAISRHRSTTVRSTGRSKSSRLRTDLVVVRTSRADRSNAGASGGLTSGSISAVSQSVRVTVEPDARLVTCQTVCSSPSPTASPTSRSTAPTSAMRSTMRCSRRSPRPANTSRPSRASVRSCCPVTAHRSAPASTSRRSRPWQEATRRRSDAAGAEGSPGSMQADRITHLGQQVAGCGRNSRCR